MPGENLNFHPLTIGQLLRRGQIKVPPNQRSYAWREKQVRYLLQDLNEAIFDQDAKDYFLGTVVLVEGGSLPSIVDGQQRLATASIILARIRDILLEMGRDKSALSIDQSYLEHIDISTEESVSRIQMNEEDNHFYNAVIMRNGFAVASKSIKPSELKPSNARLFKASVFADDFLRTGMAQSSLERQVDYLLKWEKFINEKARLLSVFVADEFSAYRMFETLNDRGLRASQVDILKNYLFSRCDKRLEEAKALWREMVSVIEPLGTRAANDEDEGQEDNDKSSDPLLSYLRHYWITREGGTKAKDLAEKVRANLTNESRVMSFLTSAARAARDYVAISRADDPKWRDYPPQAKQNIATFSEHLRVSQIKPLLFAIAHYLPPGEAVKALHLCVSWSVRFLIAGGRGGMLDTQYARRAHEIGRGDITKARELRAAMEAHVPSNEEFAQAFAVARISRAWFARYLIRAIEKKRKNLPCPEYVENEDVRAVNLEHVQPLTLSSAWDIDQDVADASYNLIGNLALMKADANKDVGNKSFDEKKMEYAKSTYLTTSEIAGYSTWGRDQILDRQKKLADLAPATWPMEFGD